MAKPKFPTLAVIILVWALMWLINDLNILKLNLPWIPVIIIITTIGMIINRYR